MKKEKTTAGNKRFEYYFTKLQLLLNQAAKQKNPALWLYTNNARTSLFMLEGLSKIYSGLHNKKSFTKIKEQLKLLEDTLGVIDYYDNIAKDFAKNKKIPAGIVNYLQAQTREKIQSLNELLIEKKWLSNEDSRVKKMQKKLSKADWLPADEEVKMFAEFYGKSIYEITEFVKTKKYRFENMETDVHELRRKLRWLSIYPQALQGCIQLAENKTSPAHLKKYQTKEIVTSPYNKMPDAADNKQFLILEKKFFYSLSWMIDALGKLKDNGLHIIALKEALQQTATLKDDAAYKKAYQLLGTKQEKLPALLSKSSAICKIYFEEHNLEHLLLATGKLK